MPDPRNTTHRIGTEYQRRLTFRADGTDIVHDATQPGGSAVVGRAVMVSGNGIVRLTGAASPVLGKLVLVEPNQGGGAGWCTVVVGGTIDLPKGDGAITVDSKIVGDVLSAARGYVRSVAAATLAEVAVAKHHVLDVTTATAIEVNLEG
jgi:hypothetical protein